MNARGTIHGAPPIAIEGCETPKLDPVIVTKKSPELGAKSGKIGDPKVN